jgi:hypothetical protein
MQILYFEILFFDLNMACDVAECYSLWILVSGLWEDWISDNTNDRNQGSRIKNPGSIQ